VVPLVGITVNHVVEVDAVKLSTLPLPLLTDTSCAGGALSPDRAVKVNLAGLTVNPPSSSAHSGLMKRRVRKANNGIAITTNAPTLSCLRCFHMLPPSKADDEAGRVKQGARSRAGEAGRTKQGG
jgi:hypothetical protein